MVTKEELKNAYKEMNGALEGVYNALERIWDYARIKGDGELMDMADNAQHFHGVAECQTRARAFYDRAIRVVEQNEQQKDLPKLLDALRTIENVKSIVNRFNVDE